MTVLARPAKPSLCVITPAFNEELNLPALYQRLCDTLDQNHVDWTWLVVDDHSSDGTFEVIRSLAERDPRITAYRLSRNSGSHAAVFCGLHYARGDCAVVMAADLQDPPETIPELIASWQNGADIVWAARGMREGKKISPLSFSRMYFWLMRNVAELENTPDTGADFLLIDRKVVNAFGRIDERNVSLFALVTWLGFRQATVFYNKEARLHGKSGWSLGRKIKLVVDSLVAFSHLPLRTMSVLGLGVSLLGFLYSGVVIFNALLGQPPEGWSSVMVAVLILSGIQMTMLGVLGEYVWRGLDESRKRPLYFVEETIGTASSKKS